MFISSVGTITVCRSAVTQSQSNYFYGGASYGEPGRSFVDMRWWKDHKTIKSAKETLPFTPDEVGAIISGIDWHCLAAPPTIKREAGAPTQVLFHS